MATDIKNPFVYGFYDAEDPFMPIAVQMCGNVQAAIDAGLSTISITGDSLTYTLTVNGKNAGTINIPSFVDDVSYDESTKELVFKYGDQYIRVSVSDLVDTYTAGEGISISGNQITCTLTDEVQSLQDKDREIVDSINNVYTKEEIDNKGFLTSHQDISGKADVSALNAVQQEVTANAANIADLEVAVSNKLDATAYTPTDLSDYSTTEQMNSAISAAVAPKANSADVYTKAEVDAAVSVKANANDVYTKAESDAALDEKLDATAYTPTDLSEYAKTADVNSAIENAVAPKANTADVYTKEVVDNALATKQDKGDYALRSEIPAVPTNVSDFTNDANYQTETDVNNAIQAVVGAAPEALDTLEEIANKLKNGDDVVAALTATVSAKANSADVYTKTEIDNKGYLTEHQSLSAYSTTEQMNSAINDAVAPKANAADVYTKSEVDAELTKKLDATAYTPTDLSEYAKTADVTSAINDAVSIKANAADVYTKSEIDNKGYLTEHQSLTAYSTTEQVNEAISSAVASKADTDNVYTKVEVDSAVSVKANTADVEASQNAQDILIVSKADANSVLSRIQMLEEKIASLSKTNVEAVNVSESTETLNDSAKDYVLNGDATSTLSVTGKSVTLSNVNVSNDARVKINAGDVEIKGTEFSGEFAKSTSNAVVSLNSAEYVSIKDATFDATSSAYNAIEIGLTSTASTLPKSVLIENCKFEGALSNNAILVFATQDNAVININNCAFENVSNVLRLSNRTNAKNITVNVTNCTVNKWEEKPEYAGFLICEDYTSTTAASAEENNLFGDGKITVNFINLVGPNGKVTAPSDMSTVCGSRDANQLVYVYRDKSGLVTYNESKYPVINIL